jgi:long-chain-fatty-acid--CoA ligase ACSBG
VTDPAPNVDQKVNDDLQKEIADLLGVPETKVDDVKQQEEEQPKEEEPAKEEKPPKKEQEKEPVVPDEDVEEKEEEKEPEKEEEEEEKPDDELTTFRSQLNDMAKKSLGIEEQETPKKEDKKEATPVEEKRVETPSTPIEKRLELSEEEFNSAMESEKGFNKTMLPKLANLVEERAKSIVENRITDLLRTLPSSMSEMIRTVVDLRFATQQFYERNKDLKDFRPFVSMVGNEVMSKNPDKSLDEAFVLIEQEVRKRLKLSTPGAAKPAKPAFVNTRGARKPQPPKLEGIRAEIADFIKHD